MFKRDQRELELYWNYISVEEIDLTSFLKKILNETIDNRNDVFVHLIKQNRNNLNVEIVEQSQDLRKLYREF